MQITGIPFSTTDFATIEPTYHNGTAGMATWRTLYLNDVRVRLVEYSAGYIADHWCLKGHIIFCAEGEMLTELQDGSKHLLTKGMMYSVGDDCAAHRSISNTGCTLFIVD
jgi:quercetin dioxygenase-like cupin family protein